MTDQEHARAIAERITAELFVNGAGEEAERLVLTDKDGRDLGGWARVVVQRRILDALSLTADTARAQGREDGLKEAARRQQQMIDEYDREMAILEPSDKPRTAVPTDERSCPSAVTNGVAPSRRDSGHTGDPHGE